MNIEPCPFCGVNLVRLHYHKADGGPEWVECANCHAKGDKRALKQDAIDSWNRLSRIVRAAEDWAKPEDEFDAAAKFGPVGRYEKAVDWANASYRALKDAVEGGRADGNC